MSRSTMSFLSSLLANPSSGDGQPAGAWIECRSFLKLGHAEQEQESGTGVIHAGGSDRRDNNEWFRRGRDESRQRKLEGSRAEVVCVGTGERAVRGRQSCGPWARSRRDVGEMGREGRSL